MYVEVKAPHHKPRFHAYYQDQVAVYGIDPIEILSGMLPRRQQRFVETWSELHQSELLTDWERLQGGRKPLSIDSLK